MSTRFVNSTEVESFLQENGIQFEKLVYHRPVLNKQVPYWKVKVGRYPCEVYNLVDWANTVYR